jgi:hypothetical protein
VGRHLRRYSVAFTLRDFAVSHGTLWSTVFGTVAAESDLHRAAYATLPQCPTMRA